MRGTKMRQIDDNDLIYNLEADFDDIPVRGNALAFGDDAEDKRCEDEIIERLESGDVWAWASVKVTCCHKDLPEIEGVDYLGGCSYLDESDFKQPGGYYDDM